jgi:hypothetical protein
MLAVQSVIYLVVVIPVMEYGSAGYPVHCAYGEGLVSVIALGYGKGQDYIVE